VADRGLAGVRPHSRPSLEVRDVPLVVDDAVVLAPLELLGVGDLDQDVLLLARLGDPELEDDRGPEVPPLRPEREQP
jgi:hypothetical protein